MFPVAFNHNRRQRLLADLRLANTPYRRHAGTYPLRLKFVCSRHLRHTALRAPPWALTLNRVCSHHPRNVSAHALSSPRGIGILAPAPRCDQRAGGRLTRRIPHTHTSHPRGTDAARLPSWQLSSSPVHPLSTIIARHPCRKSSPSTSTKYNHRTASLPEVLPQNNHLSSRSG